MKTYRILALVLALLMTLTLAACSSNNDTPSSSTTPTPPASAGSDPDNGDTASTPDTSNAPQDTSGSGGDTAPTAPQIDSHEGDEQYFTPTSPDYIITMQHMSGAVSATKEATWEEYHLFNFDNDLCAKAINKLVFENAEDATTYRDLNYITSGSYTYSVLEVIDNVIFVTDSTVLYLLGMSAEDLRGYYSPEDIVYDSMA